MTDPKSEGEFKNKNLSKDKPQLNKMLRNSSSILPHTPS